MRRKEIYKKVKEAWTKAHDIFGSNNGSQERVNP
jgi:hypothetical protein